MNGNERERVDLSALVDAAPMVLWEAGPDGSGFRYVSAGTQRLLGYVPRQWTDDPEFWWSRLHPDDREATLATIRESLSQEGVTHEYRMIATDGRTIWLRDRVRVEFEAGEPVRRVGVTVEITAQRELREQLRSAAAVFEHAAEGICITDADLRPIAANRAYTRMTGYTLSDIGGSRPPPLDRGNSGERFDHEIQPILHRDGLWEGEVYSRARDGNTHPYWLSMSSIPDDEGHTSRYIALLSDIGDLIERQDYYEHLAHHDALTGLPNRLLFQDRLKTALARARRRGHSVALAFLDVDGFKPFNDTYGHSAGDEVLAEFGRRLERVTRDAEILGRIGGDEFVLLLDEVGDKADVSTALVRVSEAISAPFDAAGAQHRLSLSAGVALFPQEADDAAALLRCADSAMYRSKRKDNTSVEFYSHSNGGSDTP